MHSKFILTATLECSNCLYYRDKRTRALSSLLIIVCIACDQVFCMKSVTVMYTIAQLAAM